MQQYLSSILEGKQMDMNADVIIRVWEAKKNLENSREKIQEREKVKYNLRKLYPLKPRVLFLGGLLYGSWALR